MAKVFYLYMALMLLLLVAEGKNICHGQLSIDSSCQPLWNSLILIPIFGVKCPPLKNQEGISRYFQAKFVKY